MTLVRGWTARLLLVSLICKFTYMVSYEFMERVVPLGDARLPWRPFLAACADWTTQGALDSRTESWRYGLAVGSVHSQLGVPERTTVRWTATPLILDALVVERVAAHGDTRKQWRFFGRVGDLDDAACVTPLQIYDSTALAGLHFVSTQRYVVSVLSGTLVPLSTPQSVDCVTGDSGCYAGQLTHLVL